MAKGYGGYKRIKVKRSRKLYRRRKSGLRKFLEVFAMVLVVGALGFVGFAAGKPLMNFFFGEKIIEPEDGVSVAAPDDDLPVTVPEEPVNVNNINNDPDNDTRGAEDTAPYNAIFAPSSVLLNSSSLSAYIRQVKSNGYNAVVLDMKDGTGNLFFASAYPPLSGTDIIRENAMTAAQIFSAFENTDVTPIARISIAPDHLSAKIPNASYAGWLDARREEGGRPWVNPFLQGARDYNAFLTAELSEAGFTEIILANMIFHNFRGIDFEIIASEYINPGSRFEGYLGLYKAVFANRGNARIILEMSLKDVTENFSGFGGTAEILRGRRELEDAALLLIYNKDDFGGELITGESSTVIIPPDISAAVNLLYKQAEIQAPGFHVIPGLVSTGLSDAETADALRAFGELGFDSFIIR